MVDIFGSDLASNADELHMDKLGEKIEVDETLYNTAVDSKIWGSATTMSSFPLIYAGSKIWDLGTTTPKNHETPEERDIHTYDKGVLIRDPDTGINTIKYKNGSYDVFKPGKCVESYDANHKFLGLTC